MQRKTRQRELLESILVAHKVHYKPRDLLEKAETENSGVISQATLYRTLSDMEANGEIQSITLSDGSTIYDGNIVPHAHFHCQACNTLFDIDPLPQDYLEMISDKYGVTISKVNVVINGYCEHCAKERR